MTHLRIEQTTGSIEEVSSSVITKLYEIAHAGLDVSSNLLGRLHVTKAYGDEIDWLTTHYPNLYITVDNGYIRFEDDDTFRFFLASIGDGVGITQQDMSTVTTSTFTFKNNTTLTNLNDFKYCTGITDIYNTGNMFAGMSNLEQITLPATIARLPANCFLYNSKLLKINCLGDITLLNHRALEACNHLTEFKSNGVNLLQSTALRDIGTLTFYNCSISGDVNLPNLLSLSASFIGCTNITSVTSIGNLTWFPNLVFQDCTGLTTVTAASGITNYGTACFRGCSNLETINMPSSIVLTSGDNNNPNQLFSGCQKLQFPLNFTINSNGVATCFERAFENCKRLTSITVGSTFTQIGLKAFENCTALTTVNHSALTIGNTAFSGCTALANLDMSGVKTIHSRALKGCSSLRGDLFLKDLHGGYSNGTWLDDGALNGSGFDSITITSSVLQRISEGPGNGKIGVMDGCPNLLKINVLGCSALTMFGGAANCPNLKTVILPSLCNTFNYNAFYNSNQLKSLVLQYNGVATLPTGNGQLYFMSSPTGKIYVPAAYVNDYKTTYPYFESRIDSFVNYPGEWEFVDKTFSTGEYQGYNFSSVIIKGNTNLIPENCFKDCANLTSVTLSSTITSVGYQSFYQSGLTGVLNLPAILTIGGTDWNDGSSFEGCTGITEVHCGSNLTRVGYGAFRGCTSLTTFSTTSTNFNIYRNAFDGCTSLASITLPSSMTEIGHATFWNCLSLETINLDNITRFTPTGGLAENNAFYNCTNLFKNTGIVHMPNLTFITGNPFNGCSYIKMFIAENLEDAYKSDYPFGNTAIEAYIAPKLDKTAMETLALTGDYFHSCPLVGNATLKVLEIGKVDNIEKQAFRLYSSLTAIVLHQLDTIITLGDYSSGDAFSIYFPNQNIKLYVPDSMVASYQADSVWSNFTSHIAPISEYDFSDHISDSSLVSYYNSVFNSSAS